MPNWSNWSTRHQCEPAEVHFVRSTEDIKAIVSASASAGKRIRTAGSGHSHYPLVPTGDVILDTSGLAGLIDVDASAKTATMWAGSTIYSLGRPLNDRGFGLKNQGDIDRQAIVGAISTGTHGTGRQLQNLSASVTAMTVVLATGDVVRCSARENQQLFEVARLSLGAAGVISQVEMSVREAYRLKEGGLTADFDQIRDDIMAQTEAHRHFEFFWYPRRDRVIAKWIDDTTDEPVYPLAPEGQRCAWSHEVLPNHRPEKHTEMEFSVPLARGLACLDEIRALIQRDFPTLRWPVEFRTVAADDVWLSTANGRDIVTISVHQGIDQDDSDLFHACESVFRHYEGLPHWGKVHYYTGPDLSERHPHYDKWWQARDEFDPGGVFLNDVLASLRPA
ncbi:MAG: FAD-binding protein [Pseudomonadales bacterium]|nr:FAD-binding protein [Pseudomonadales bacterium]